MTTRVGIVQTGTANLASVLAAFRRADAEPYLIHSAAEIERESYVVLPGVGAFGAAMQVLRQEGLIQSLQERMQAGRPTLAICLGLQLLCAASEETPGVEGLSLLPFHIRRFEGDLRIPQFGWSEVSPQREGGFFEAGYAYFANSYRLPEWAADWEVATSQYGGSYVAAMRKEGVVACQFHPELSGQWGHQLLTRWLQLEA